MAVIDPSQLQPLYLSGTPHKFVVFQVPKVNTGDTLDLSSFFSKVQSCVFIAVTTISASLPQVAGTSLTFAAASLNNESGYLMVLGAPA